jgi:hypothetical protein
MERIAISRVTVLPAHRSFCESNRLLAEGERLRAEARKYGAGADAIAGARRATARARLILRCSLYDLTFEDEAIIAMREVAPAQRFFDQPCSAAPHRCRAAGSDRAG